jgi:predicted transcriptional regulator
MSRGKAAEKGNILKRQILALEFRKMGLSYRKIAERLDVSLAQAYRDITDELARLSALKQDVGEDLRQLQLERLDMAIEGAMPFVQAGSAAHITAYSGVIEKQSKIAGILTSAEVTININIEIVQRFESAARDAGFEPSVLLEQFIQELHAQRTNTDTKDNPQGTKTK